MNLTEARQFAALHEQVNALRAERHRMKALLKGATGVGYQRALRYLAKHPTGALLLKTWRAGKAEGRRGC